VTFRLEYRESCVETLQLRFFVLQSQLLNKAICNSPLEAEPTVLNLEFRLKVKTSFSGHPCGFRLHSALYTSLKWNMRLSDTNLQVKTGGGSHSMGRGANNFAKGQKVSHAEAIKT